MSRGRKKNNYTSYCGIAMSHDTRTILVDYTDIPRKNWSIDVWRKKTWFHGIRSGERITVEEYANVCDVMDEMVLSWLREMDLKAR